MTYCPIVGTREPRDSIGAVLSLSPKETAGICDSNPDAYPAELTRCDSTMANAPISKIPEDVNRQARRSADLAVEQFKLNAQISATCPDCAECIQVDYVGPPSDTFLTKCKCRRSNFILRGVMGPLEAVLRRRGDVVRQAAGATVLDAAFYAMYFTEKERGEYFGCPLDPEEVLPNTSADVIADAVERSRRLYNGPHAYVGAAFFEYPDVAMTYEAAVTKLRRDNPGFSDDVYGVVIHDSIRGMR